MLKAININGVIPSYKFCDKPILLKPFIMSKKTPNSKKLTELEIKAICMKDSKSIA